MTERIVSTDDGVALMSRVDGDDEAPVLLLLNSLGTGMEVWDLQVPGWARSHRVVRFDQRGHGRSEAPSPPYTIDRLGQDALAVLDAYDITTADICGLSLGGLVALWLVARRPDRVGRAVLADTAARVGTEDGWRARAAAVRDGGMACVADVVIERFFSPSFRERGPAVVQRVRRQLLTIAEDGYVGSCEALATADLREDLGSVTTPCLVIVGTADEATPIDDAQELHEALTSSTLEHLPGAGHLANLERPEQFEQLVTGFLSTDASGVSPTSW